MVVPSACLNASKITRILPAAMPDARVAHRERDQVRVRVGVSEPAYSKLLPDGLRDVVPGGPETSSTDPESV
ncbi:hypothetical protein GCM10023238_13260 [Streptomyces heliomycini]